MNSILKATIRKLLPKSLRPHRIWSGPNRGRVLVTSWYDYPSAIIGSCEQPLLHWMEMNVGKGETWLDIGAHYGNTAIKLCDCVGPAGRVIAFEPNLASAGCLAQTRRINSLSQLTVMPFGLTSGDGWQLLKLPEIRGMVDSTIPLDKAEFFETIIATPFAKLWSQIHEGNPAIHGVKIDVQGMEIDVLRGIGKLLLQHRPKLIVEVHEGVSRPELLSLLEALGYAGLPESIDPLPGEAPGELIDNQIYHIPAMEAAIK